MGWGPADILLLVVPVLKSGIIEAVVRLIERLYPTASGEEKKEEAMKVVGADLSRQAKAFVSVAIDYVVAEYNQIGVFTHRSNVPGGAVGSPGDAGSSSGFAR